MTDPRQSDKIQELLMRAIDGELSAAQRLELERLLATDPSLAAELSALTQASQAASRFGVRNPNPGDWLEFERSLRGRSGRWAGWLLLAVGYVTLLGAGAHALFTDAEAPIAVKLGVAAMAMGAALLFAYVARVFWRERREDPYKDIVR